IPRKIVAIAMIITVSALLLAGVVLTGYDFLAAKRDLQAGTTVFARIIADNVTAAVEFNDQVAAMDTLSSLPAEPSIVSPCIYKGTELFAERAFLGGSACPRELRDDFDQEGFVVGTSSIVLQGKQIGMVRLLASTSSVFATVRMAVIVLTLVLAVSVLFAL